MPLEHWARYTRHEIRSNPDILFAFGDNLAGTGLGGQAKEARGEPNAVGIPTKRRPSIDADAFFTDDDLPTVKPIIQAAFRRMADHIEKGGTVVFPRDGVGTGLARLHETAPAVSGFIDLCYQALVRVHYKSTRP